MPKDMTNNGAVIPDQGAVTQLPKAGRLRKKFNSYGLEPEVKIIIDKDTYERIIEAMTRDPVLSAFFPVKARDERTNVYHDTAKKFHLFARGAEMRGRLEKPARPAATGKPAKLARYKYDLKTPHDLANPKIGPNDHDLVIRGERSHKRTDVAPVATWFTDAALVAAEYQDDEGICPNAIASEVEELVEYLGPDLTDKKFVPWVQGTFKRHIFEMSHKGHAIEVAVEKGRFQDLEGTRESDEFYVIELESKGGDEVDLDGLIKAISHVKQRFKAALGVDLETSGKTKGEMAFEWLYSEGLIPEEVRANFETAMESRKALYTDRRKAQETKLAI